MATKKQTDYETFEVSSIENRRMLREEELILEVAEKLSAEMERRGISKTQLARRLNKTKGFVSQLLSGGRNLTLRTIADVAEALGYRVHIVFAEEEAKRPQGERIFLEKYLKPSGILSFQEWNYINRTKTQVRRSHPDYSEISEAAAA